MNVLAIVPARGGSKGIPRKNMLMTAGRPLVDWTLECAHLSKRVNAIALSTDDPAIMERAHAGPWKEKTQVVERPAALATDEATTESAMLDVLNHSFAWDADVLVLLQPTSPLRYPWDIDQAVDMLEQGYDSIVSVVPSHHLTWAYAPDGSPVPSYMPKARPRRQDFSQFDENGSIYVVRTEAFERERCRIAGKVGLYTMDGSAAIQIDKPLDAWLVERMLIRDSSAPFQPWRLEYAK